MEDIKVFEEKLEALGKQINEKLNANSEQYKNASKEIKDAILKEMPEFKEFKDIRDKMTKMQEQLDGVDTKIQRLPVEKPARKSIVGATADVLEELKKMGDGSLRNFWKRNKNFGEIELKVDDMTQANSFQSTSVVQAQHMPGIIYDPDTQDRARNFILPGTTSSNAVEYVQEYALTDSTDVTAEGSEYKQSDFDLKLASATVRKITAYVIVSEEMLEDVDALQSYINARLPSKLKLKENYQLLYGDGTGINLSGLTTNATAYSDELADSKVTRLDVLVSAAKQVRTSEYRPSFGLIHPTDALQIKLAKNDNGDYIHPYIFMPQPIVLDGIPIYESTMITSGDFLVGSREAAQLFDRRQMTLEMTNTNEDNFIKGMVTFRISERLTVAVYRPKALIYGTFAAALAKGSA